MQTRTSADRPMMDTLILTAFKHFQVEEQSTQKLISRTENCKRLKVLTGSLLTK